MSTDTETKGIAALPHLHRGLDYQGPGGPDCVCSILENLSKLPRQQNILPVTEQMAAWPLVSPCETTEYKL